MKPEWETQTAWKPGFSPDTSVFSALETFVHNSAIQNLHLPYHTITSVVLQARRAGRRTWSCVGRSSRAWVVATGRRSCCASARSACCGTSSCTTTAASRAPPPPTGSSRTSCSARPTTTTATRCRATAGSPDAASCRCATARVRRPAYPGPDLQNILRQSYDYLTIMPKLRSTYDERLIYKTSYNEWKAFHR